MNKFKEFLFFFFLLLILAINLIVIPYMLIISFWIKGFLLSVIYWVTLIALFINNK